MILIKQQFGCYYCGRPILIGTKNKQSLATADHVIPLYLGGEPYGANLVAACNPCNNQKGPLTAEEFIGLRTFPLQLREARRRAAIEAQIQGNNPVARQAVKSRQRLAAAGSRQRLYDALRPVLDSEMARRPGKFLSNEDLKMVLTRGTAWPGSIVELLDDETLDRYLGMLSERGGMVDAADLKSAGLGRAGSNPAACTNEAA